MSNKIYAQSDKVIALPISVDRTIVGYKNANNQYSTTLDEGFTQITAYNGKAITEQNLTTLLRSFIDIDYGNSSNANGNCQDGFIIDYAADEGNIYEMSFILSGYYFNVKESNAKDINNNPYPSIFSNKPLYACLEYNRTTEDGYAYLVGDTTSSTSLSTDYITLSIEFKNNNCGGLIIDKYSTLPITENIKLAIKKGTNIVLDNTSFNPDETVMVKLNGSSISFENNKYSLNNIIADHIITLETSGEITPEATPEATPEESLGEALVQYKGLYFTNTEPDNTVKYLQLLDTNGNIPTESYFKFTTRSIRNINGGTI